MKKGLHQGSYVLNEFLINLLDVALEVRVGCYMSTWQGNLGLLHYVLLLVFYQQKVCLRLDFDKDISM